MSWAKRRLLPVATVLAVLLLVWYVAAVGLNAQGAIERVLAPRGDWTARDLVATTLTMQRPVLPGPHQVFEDMLSGIIDWPLDSPRSLVYHAAVTGQATLLGFVMGALIGTLFAVGIVHSRTLRHAVLPWVVASQAVPVLAIAPIVIVLLGSLGLAGLIPKAVIAMYLCFFPVTVALVAGLRSPERLQLELLHTYAASPAQTFWTLRVPAALPFLFPALRVAVAAGLVGAMVAELPTGAQAGLGARLLTGSYYGNTVQIWAALCACALLGLLFTGLIAALEVRVLRRWRAR